MTGRTGHVRLFGLVGSVLVLVALGVVTPGARAQTPWTPCPDGLASAITFGTVPTKVPYGATVPVEFSGPLLDLAVGPRVTAENDTGSFDETTLSAGDFDTYGATTLDMFMPLDSSPLVISLQYKQRSDPIGNPAATCDRAFERRINGYRHILLPRDCQTGTYRPTRLQLGCGTNGYVVARVSWRSWNRAVATATGTALVPTCRPSCASGNRARHRVALRASRIRFCEAEGGYRYTRLSARLRGGTIQVPVGCSDIPVD